MPISRSQEGRVTEMLKYIFYDDEGQVLWAKGSYFSRMQVPALPFLLHASKTKSLRSPPVPPGFPSVHSHPGALTMTRAKQDTKICPSMRHLQCTEMTGVTETVLRTNLDPLSSGCFEKTSVIVQLFFFRKRLPCLHVYGDLLPKVHHTTPI